jgi:acetyl-CoA C-acetyltransferase
MKRAEVWLVAAARSPFGKFFGALRDYSAVQLAAICIDQLLERTGIEPASVDALFAGVGMASAGCFTPARQAVLGSRLPDSTASLAVDRACCSGMTAIGLAYREILAGDAQLAICGGFESLSRTPLLARRQRRSRPGDPSSWDPAAGAEDPLLLKNPVGDQAIAKYTGEEALARGVSRAQQDSWALQSHQRYFAAEMAGLFVAERFALPELSVDEGPRGNSSLASLQRSSTIYDSPAITAGNAPGLSDGAAFVALATPDRAQQLGLKPLARLLDHVSVAGGPTSGSYTPALAIQRLLSRTRMQLDDLALFEINEAYAATPLVSTLELAGGDVARAEQLRQRCNIRGGAVAIGHPLGASGARITMSLAQALLARGGGRGAAAICGGFGQGDGLLLETVD